MRRVIVLVTGVVVAWTLFFGSVVYERLEMAGYIGTTTPFLGTVAAVEVPEVDFPEPAPVVVEEYIPEPEPVYVHEYKPVSRHEEVAEPAKVVEAPKNVDGKNKDTFFTTSYYGGPGIEGGPVTAMGTTVEWGVIAVDPDVIPLGTEVMLYNQNGDYMGTFTAEDTGGMIQGNRIDLAFDDYSGMASWQNQQVTAVW